MAQDPFLNTFSFKVEFFDRSQPGQAANEEKKPLYEAAFSDVDGLEITLEPKTIKEGGNNTRQIHLAGPVTYAQLNLKRGMTRDVSLWKWFSEVIKTTGHGLRYDARITLQSSQTAGGKDERQPELVFKVYGCLPTKLRTPTLNAREGGLAIEEMTLVYEGFDVESPGQVQKETR